jgi:N-formylglutamate amidohydrolase
VHDQFVLSDAELEAEAEQSADLWTDVLARASWPNAVHIAPAISRIVVDVERYPDDADEEMARVGRGAIYAATHDGRPLRRSLRPDERQSLIAAYHTPHWSALRTAAAGRVLVDLHSYPRKAWPIEPNTGADRPEIDIGTDPGLTPPAWAHALRRHFEAEGYGVGFDTPYAGVIDAGAEAAVMIEIRRDLLGTGPDCDAFRRLARVLAGAPRS